MHTCFDDIAVHGHGTSQRITSLYREEFGREKPSPKVYEHTEPLPLTVLKQRVGNTPLIRLPSAALGSNPMVNVFAKLEYFNPSGSIKDRLVSHWLTKMQLPNTVDIVLASSGNSAASLSMFGHSRQRRVHIFTPNSTSLRKLDICKAYGATIHLCERDYEREAADFAIANGYALFDQYNDLLNVEAYEVGLGPEILREVPDIDYFVAAASTGGTISGVGKFLHTAKPDAKVILADPVGSILHRYMTSGTVDTSHYVPHGVEGAGKDKITDCFIREHIDSSIAINAESAFAIAHSLSKQFSVPSGLSSGLIAAACSELSKRCVTPKNIVCVFPDSATRYIDRLGL